MSEPEVYPLSEAAFVLREPVKDVRKTVERRNIQYHLVSLGGRKVRAVDRKTLVFLSWSSEQRDLLSRELWRKVYEALKGHEHLPSRIDTGGLTAWFGEASQRVQARLETLRAFEEQVAHNSAGEAVLKGTDIEVHRIAALLSGGMTIEEVLEDYPSLSTDQVAFAEAYAAAHPKPGRPYPKITAKAAMRKADLSGLDLDTQAVRYLIDTDVLGKKDGPNGKKIRKWLASVDDNMLAISALTVFEISKGVQKKREAGEDELASILQASLEQVKAGYADRTLPIDAKLADSWGEIAGSDCRHWMDRGLIATAKEHALILVTCNTKDMKGRGVEVIGPERDPPGHWAPDGTPIKPDKA